MMYAERSSAKRRKGQPVWEAEPIDAVSKFVVWCHRL